MKYCFQQISFNYTSLDSNKVGTFLFPQTPCQWKQTRTHRVNGNRNWQFLAITSIHSKNFLTLILPHANTKSLAIKAFHDPFHSKVSRFLRAEQHTPHDAFAETNPPAVLSSIRIPILDRVWYHAPWWRRYRRYRRCDQLLFGRLLW